MPSNSTLHVSRPSGKYRDTIRSYRIEIDGIDRGAINSGGELSIQVPAGMHVVNARIDWSGSRHLNLEFEPGQTVHIRVEPNGGAWNALFQVFSSEEWIRITPA